MDSAASLTGCLSRQSPRLHGRAFVGRQRGHEELGELVRSARAVALDRLRARLGKAVAEGEIPASIDLHALARFVQTVQNGMSIRPATGGSRGELEAVTQVAMIGWDARIRIAAGRCVLVVARRPVSTR